MEGVTIGSMRGQPAASRASLKTETSDVPPRRIASWTLLAVMWYQGLATPLLAITAPWIALRFNLDAVGLARLYALMSLSALLAFGAARLADRLGRRSLLLICLASTSIMAVAAAMSGSIVMFAACELVRFSAAVAIANSANALLAETAPDSAARTSALGRAAMAAAAGGATLLVLMPVLNSLGHSFRWAYGIGAVGVVFVPALLLWVPESRRWERAQVSGALGRSSLFSVFRGRWSCRAVAVIGASLLNGVEGAAVGAWSYYYGVTVLGLSPRIMSVLSVIATVLGFVGFRVGTIAAERLGRVTTAVAFGLLHQAAALWIYLGPPAHFSRTALWMGFGLALSGLGASASGIAKATASVELFPTSLRVTMLGWIALAGATATGCANLLVSTLVAPLGGVSRAIALLSLSGVVGLIVFGLRVDETRGMTLENAALEEETGT
jgi:MFS family permease